MKFYGTKRNVAVDADYKQIAALTQFWAEMRQQFPNEQLLGLGANWVDQTSFDYYIGKINQPWDGGINEISLPDDNWKEFQSSDSSDDIKNLYRTIYKQGKPLYEIEAIEDGKFTTKVYFRSRGEK